MRTWMSVLVVTASGMLACGCSKPWVRPYEWKDRDAALQTLAQRARSIHSVQAACGITLTDRTGQSVNFDAAIVVKMDEQGEVWLRLRTWKFSQAVFDVTVRPDGTWVLASEEAMKRQSEGLAGVNHHDLAVAWQVMLGWFYDHPDAKVIDEGGSQFTVEFEKKPAMFRAIIDRATLTVSEHQVLVSGHVVQRLVLSQYREIGPDAIPWPMRIKAENEEGAIEVRLEDVEINGVIAENAFTPPRRAVRQEEGKKREGKAAGAL